MTTKKGFLAIGNFDSNVGYAWRLMESFWCRIANQLAPQGYQPYICFPSISTVPECLTTANFQVHQIDFNKSDLSSLLAQAKFIRQNNIKVIYLTDFKPLDIRYLFYRMAGAEKIITHDHAPGIRTTPKPAKFIIKQLLHRLPWICSDACFAVSPYIAQRMQTINGVPPHKISCITNGIPMPDTPEPSRRKDSNSLAIVTVARATHYKGIDFAIKVMAQLLKTNKQEITYTLYGDGPNMDEFKALAAQLDIADQVVFAGKVDGIQEKLLAADIAFHPSQGEAMSLAILEYMRAQLPVVVSSNPSVSSFLTHDKNALIYAENSIESATHSIQRLIDSNDLRSAIGKEAWQSVKDQFNETLMYDKLASCIQKTLG